MDALNIPAKFEVRSFTQSWDYRGVLSLGASCLGNPCEYSHKPYITGKRLIELHFAVDSLCLSSFKFFWWAPKTILFRRGGRFGRSRSSKVDIFGANRKRGVDFLLVRNSNFGPILHRFRDMTGFMCYLHHPYSTPILGVFPLHQIAHVGRQPAHGP